MPETSPSYTHKTPLVGMTLDQLKQVVKELGMPSFTASQMAQWIYQGHVTDIEQMTNISKANRAKLGERYHVGAMPPVDCQRSVDGTVKYLFPTDNGRYVETVYIPDGERATLCVSCQVGCKMNCLFCQTGKQGFEGNLSVRDIINQIYSLPERETLTNVVFMGQGEPMDNLDAVLQATAHCSLCLCVEPAANHREQCGSEKQTQTVPRRERVSCGHLAACSQS